MSTDKELFTPEAWDVYRKPDAKVYALQRSAMCIDEGTVGVKATSIRERCQNIYTLSFTSMLLNSRACDRIQCSKIIFLAGGVI